MLARISHQLSAAAIALCAATTMAQTTLPIMSPPNPGARSLALGGAFVAQADDATAAYSNPAGLVALIRPEISGELRFSVYDNAFEDSHNQKSEDDILTIGFLSAVYPIHRWSIAIYRNQFSVLNTDTDQADQFLSNLDLTTYGLAAGYRLNDHFSLGLGIAYNEGNQDFVDADDQSTSSDDDWGLTAGVIWRLGKRWQLGGSYRNGPDVVFGTGPDSRRLGFPSVTAVGFSYRTLGGGLTISGEWDHVWYSNSDSLRAELDDQDEPHLGIEYAILAVTPVMALRFGAWHDPVGAQDGVSGDFEGEMHYSSGFGLAFSRFQVDFAIDYSDPVITTSISSIFVF